MRFKLLAKRAASRTTAATVAFLLGTSLTIIVPESSPRPAAAANGESDGSPFLDEAGEQMMPGGGSFPYTVHFGRYVNNDYGYSMMIPDGLHGLSSPASSFRHELLIKLPAESPIQLSAHSAHMYATRQSFNQLANQILGELRTSSSDLLILLRYREQLGTSPAMRLVVSYTDTNTHQTIVEERIIARRACGDSNAPEIMYELTLRTRRERYDQDRRLFETLIASWREQPINETR